MPILVIGPNHGPRIDVVQLATRAVAQLVARFALVPKVLGSNPAFSTKHMTCLSSLPVDGLNKAKTLVQLAVRSLSLLTVAVYLQMPLARKADVTLHALGILNLKLKHNLQIFKHQILQIYHKYSNIHWCITIFGCDFSLESIRKLDDSSFRYMTAVIFKKLI